MNSFTKHLFHPWGLLSSTHLYCPRPTPLLQPSFLTSSLVVTQIWTLFSFFNLIIKGLKFEIENIRGLNAKSRNCKDQIEKWSISVQNSTISAMHSFFFFFLWRCKPTCKEEKDDEMPASQSCLNTKTDPYPHKDQCLGEITIEPVSESQWNTSCPSPSRDWLPQNVLIPQTMLTRRRDVSWRERKIGPCKNPSYRQQKNKRRENRGEPINKQTKSRVRRDQTEKREEKSKGKGRRENSPRVLELLLSPSLSSSPGKVFLFSLFLHICCKRRKQCEGSLITFALCSAHVVWATRVCCPTGSLAWASDQVGPAGSNPVHAS